jgi:hypothetical protein
VPLLLDGGAGALGWWRIREDPILSNTESGRSLYAAYLQHSVNSARNEAKLAECVDTLSKEGIKPLVVKGWAIARKYPESGLRPYGDLDLIFDPDDYQKAMALLASRGWIWPVDAHNGPGELTDYEFDELFKRSEVLNLEGVELRVPSAEDHFRILCYHLVKHGLRRPLWSCDIAVMLGSLSEEFDWDYFLGSNPVTRSWIANTVLLAGQLLGAELQRCPPEIRDIQQAQWMEKAVTSQWSFPFSRQAYDPVPISKVVWKPLEVPSAIRRRWPNPFEACFKLGIPFDRFPRITSQLAASLVRGGRFLTNLRPATHKST